MLNLIFWGSVLNFLMANYFKDLLDEDRVATGFSPPFLKNFLQTIKKKMNEKLNYQWNKEIDDNPQPYILKDNPTKCSEIWSEVGYW